MSNNGEQPRIPITCPVCQQSFSAKMPLGDIVNTLRSSGIIAPHERLTKCICGQAFLLGVTTAQLAWAWQPVGDDVVQEVEGSRVITSRLITPH